MKSKKGTQKSTKEQEEEECEAVIETKKIKKLKLYPIIKTKYLREKKSY